MCWVVRFMAFCLQNSCRHPVNIFVFPLRRPAVGSRYSFREFYPQNSWPPFGTYVCVNSVILDVPGRHSVSIAVSSTFRLHNSWSTGLRQIYLLNSSRLPYRKFEAHICFVNIFIFWPVSQIFWTVIQKVFISLSGDENEQHFVVNRSVAIHFHIAFRINSQSVRNERTPILLF